LGYFAPFAGKPLPILLRRLIRYPSADTLRLVQIEDKDAVVIDLRLFKRVGSYDLDQVPPAKRGSRNINCSKAFWHEPKASSCSSFHRFESDLAQFGFIIQRRRLRSAKHLMCIAPKVYLPFVIYRDVNAAEEPLLRSRVKP